jgi:hypothetical protein
MKTTTGAQAAVMGLAVFFLAAAVFIPQQAISGSSGNGGCAPDLSKNHQPQKIERRCPLR